jgi:hypothetical protein
MTIIYTVSCDLMMLQCSYMLKVLVQDLHLSKKVSEFGVYFRNNNKWISYTARAALCLHDIFSIFSGEKYIFFKALYYVAYLYVLFGASLSLWMLLVSVIHCGHTEELNNRYETYSVSTVIIIRTLFRYTCLVYSCPT